jgi:UDP-glucose 4-epimerase
MSACPRGVLVTGATTPVGLAIIRRLLREPGIEAVLCTGAEADPVLPDDPRVSYVQADLTRSRTLRQLLYQPAQSRGVELVIHTALHRRAADCGGARAHALNVECTRELLHVCERHPTIRRFLYKSGAEVYRVTPELPVLVDEDHPLEMSPGAPQWRRDRVEADLTVCARIGTSSLDIVVLRTAECVEEGTGSQLYDYLQSQVCFLPLGYDPMLNLLSLVDMAEAVCCAARFSGHGIFNVPGRDTLPLSALVRAWGRIGVPVPGFALSPLYRLRTMTLGAQRADFRYDLNRDRLHFDAILDGRRAASALHYEPRHSLFPIPP